LFLAVFYLYQVERITEEGVVIHQIQERLGVLSRENLELSKKSGQIFSLGNLEKEIAGLGFVATPRQIKYLPLSSEYLAQQTLK